MERGKLEKIGTTGVVRRGTEKSGEKVEFGSSRRACPGGIVCHCGGRIVSEGDYQLAISNFKFLEACILLECLWGQGFGDVAPEALEQDPFLLKI